MAKTVDRTVLIVSALAVFFATLFAALLVLEPSSDSDENQPSVVGELPDVAAPPPTESPLIVPVPTERRVERKLEALEALGVECRDEDCLRDP